MIITTDNSELKDATDIEVERKIKKKKKIKKQIRKICRI